MGKGRAPCCDKSKVKRGPWSPAEDLRLITFIQKHGHENWRALPKQAGLLRCGKSCRLRWINYLRPDVKRGNFTKEEEETIIKLHQSLGNKWSRIASLLPGRTDNEIKNVWNTHLKKRSTGNVKVRLQGHYSPSYCSPSSSSSDVIISSCDDKINDSQIMDRDQEQEAVRLADHKSCVSQDCRIQSNETGEGDILEQGTFEGCNYNITISSNESFRSSVSQELNLSNSCQDDHSRMLTVTTTTTPTTTTDEQIDSSLDFTALRDEVNKPFVSEDFPVGFQDDTDIDIDWSVLWHMEDIFQSDDTNQLSLTSNIIINNNNNNTVSQCEFGGNGTEVDNNKWLSYLENELGLID